MFVLDDLIAQAGRDYRVTHLFTKGCHKNLPVICMVQNIFHQGKEIKNVSVTSITLLWSSPLEINSKYPSFQDRLTVEEFKNL